MTRLQKTSRYIAVCIAMLLICVIIIFNSVPFSISKSYSSNNKGVFAFSPASRIRTENGNTKQIDNLIYFSSKMPFNFDRAKVKIKFKNPSIEQQILLGYKDQYLWHYNSQILDAPIINNLNWKKIGSGPYLYQKQPTYSSIDDYFNHPPENKVLGTFDYTDDSRLQPKIVIPNYSPSASDTKIDTPLRGNVILYAYLNKEMFKMNFTKQDLNWYTDPDTAKISVYKGKDKVFDATIDDDGNTTSNHKSSEPQTLSIQNPGPGLPESGVYKVVIDISNDTIIKSITTNLHKIVFEGPLYLAENHEIYSTAIKKTKSNTLITNAQKINFISEHGVSHTVTVGKQSINIDRLNELINTNNTLPATEIQMPRSDIIVNGSGYFAFHPEQYFTPSPYKILPIRKLADINQVDYILTNYPGMPKKSGDWNITEKTFNIKDAFIGKNRQLSWLITAPGLKENKVEIEYEHVGMTLSKQGWFKD
jgi:hypothetical protein